MLKLKEDKNSLIEETRPDKLPNPSKLKCIEDIQRVQQLFPSIKISQATYREHGLVRDKDFLKYWNTFTEFRAEAGILTDKPDNTLPKILILDIELFPILAFVWDIWDQNISHEQIVEDWSIASWSAKWYGQSEILYADVRNQTDLRDDKPIVEEMWRLIDSADIVVTQNGKSFDIKKLNARFFKHKIHPTTSFRHYDTKIIAKRYFKFTSNKLGYMTTEFNEKYKKLEHGKFPGWKLWLGCMARNLEAWAEMEEYNKYDVLSLEELFEMMLPWDKTINWNVFNDDYVPLCSCMKTDLYIHPKEKTTNLGAYTRMVCKSCGKEHFVKDNLLTVFKRSTVLR